MFIMLASDFFTDKKKHFYAVSRTLQVRHREPSVRHSVLHFLPNSGVFIACQVAELIAALCLDTRAKKWKYKFK